MHDFDLIEADSIEDFEQATLESVVGMDSFLFEPLFDEEVELLESLSR